ncbi:MAG: ABC transporter ATP-binding protein [bacterium]|nr:ABC transporter ATP-binding protein [bacterium]
MADVRFEHVTKKYGRLIAVNQVSFECREGEFFTLLGPSGAGKTTILELIAGLKKTNGGNVYIADRCVNDVLPQDRDVAMAFENYALYSHMNVYENIAFPLRSPKRNEKLTPAQERKKVEEITTLLGIQDYLERKPQQLSGGQKQRVSLARAMIRRPQVYLLDEPIAHLDAKLKFLARANLKKIAKEYGVTIIYVTHNYREALALSDRILVLREGVVQQIGPPHEIYEAPVNDFTANIVGEPPINLIDGEIILENGTAWFQANQYLRFLLHQEALDRIAPVAWEEKGKKKVRLGVRPDHVKISDRPISDDSFQAPIYVVEREGEKSILTFDLEGTFFLARIPGAKYKPADKVWIEFDPNAVFFFRKTLELKV